MLLHEHKDYSDLIAAVSDAMGIDPTLVEKDYWIMHTGEDSSAQYADPKVAASYQAFERRRRYKLADQAVSK